MSVRIQATPNPNARKFILTQKQFDQPINVSNPDACEHRLFGLLVKRLFDLGGIYNVLLAQDFITINKFPAHPWEALEQPVVALIEEFFP